MSGRNPRVSAKAAMTRDLTVEAVGDPVNWCSTRPGRQLGPTEDLTRYDRLTAKVQVMSTLHSLVTTEIARARGFFRYPW
ncbi:MAG: hypothetical protein QOD59_1270 [Mycobacterium sp.]|jgi:hypothetical protein|nr:hypothetical protein [Mycobacterium sp.]